MKNLKKILILLILFVPCFVMADMGAPETRPYEMVVVSPDGVDYYSSSDVSSVKGHLNKGDTISVGYENDGIFQINVGSDWGYIKSLDNLSLVKDSFDPTESSDQDSYVTKYDEKKNAIVYAEDGVDLLQGPADIYKKVTHLKKGTKLTYQYYSGMPEVYIYVEYNGKKGWVEILDKKVLIENTRQYIFRVDTKTSCGTIPKNTIMTPAYKTDQWSKSALFKYNNCEELLDVFRSEDVMVMYKQRVKSKVEIPIYDTSDRTNTIETIPADTEFIVHASSDSMMGTMDVQYVEYNGKMGWTFVTYDSFDSIEYLDDSKVEDTALDEETKADNNKKEVKKEAKEEKKPAIDAKEIVIFCVIGGVVVALTATVTIILINKKRKNKKKTEDVEIKEEQE